MADMNENKSVELTEEAKVIVELTRALYTNEIDEVFRILGRHLDKHQLKVSEDILDEYKKAGRVIDH